MAKVVAEGPPKLIQPREHTARICIWSDLTVSDMDMINEAATPEKIKLELGRIFDMVDYEENPKKGVLMELYFNVIQFARSKGLSKEQTSCLFSIVKKTHEVATETPFGNLMQTYRYFEGLILCHSVKRPPYSIDVFRPDEVRPVVQFVLDTYFRHYKMYKFVFTPMVHLDVAVTYVDKKDNPVTVGMEEGRASATPAVSVTDEPGEKLSERKREKSADGSEREGRESQQGEVTPEPKPKTPPAPENPAVKELKGMIRNYLSEQMKVLKIELGEQLKSTEEKLTSRLQKLEPTPPKTPSKPQKGKK